MKFVAEKGGECFHFSGSWSGPTENRTLALSRDRIPGCTKPEVANFKTETRVVIDGPKPSFRLANPIYVVVDYPQYPSAAPVKR